MKSLKLIAATLALVTSSAFAQAVAPEQKAAIKDLLEALNFKFMMSQMSAMMSQGMPQMLDQMVEGLSSGGKLTPEQTAEARAIAAASREESARQMTEMFADPTIMQGMEDIVAENYARHFSTIEIKAITAFYVSPAGKKVLALTPQIMSETMPKIVAVMQPRMKAMMEKKAAEFVAKAGKGKQPQGAATTK
ncbi:MAG: DUF2059 domain-containing protein [Betaproteobacteria bacterium]